MSGEEVTYEVWREHFRGGPDVRLYHGLTEKQALEILAICEADKADGYPDAPIEFYIVRATTTREQLTTPTTEALRAPESRQA